MCCAGGCALLVFVLAVVVLFVMCARQGFVLIVVLVISVRIAVCGEWFFVCACVRV